MWGLLRSYFESFPCIVVITPRYCLVFITLSRDRNGHTPRHYKDHTTSIYRSAPGCQSMRFVTAFSSQARSKAGLLVLHCDKMQPLHFIGDSPYYGDGDMVC